MSERISALVDGELPEEQAMDELAGLRRAAGDRDAWGTYHLIGDAIRGDLYPSSLTATLTRLAQEPTMLAPQRSGHRKERLLRYAMSAVAGATGVAFVIWTAGPAINAGSPQTAVLSPVNPQVQAPTQANQPANAGKKQPASKGGVESYLFVHQQTASGLPSVTPVAWTPERAAGGKR